MDLVLVPARSALMTQRGDCAWPKPLGSSFLEGGSRSPKGGDFPNWDRR